MRFKKIVMVVVLGLMFANSAWGAPENWAIFVPTREQCVASHADYIGNFYGAPYDKTGIDHIEWYNCTFGFLCTDDPSAFNQYDILGDYYDCEGNLLQADAVVSGGWNIIRGTGTALTGGIGGHPRCYCEEGYPAAEHCRVQYDMTPVKRSPNYCTTWPSIPPPNPEENLGDPSEEDPSQGSSDTDNNPDKCNDDDLFAGNPVNVATGNKFERVLDLSVSTSGQPLVFRRSYNSQASSDGPLGYRWTHSYDVSLEVVATTPATRLRIWDSDGRALYFTQIRQTIADEIPFTGESGVKDRLKKVISTGEYFLRRKGAWVRMTLVDTKVKVQY